MASRKKGIISPYKTQLYFSVIFYIISIRLSRGFCEKISKNLIFFCADCSKNIFCLKLCRKNFSLFFQLPILPKLSPKIQGMFFRRFHRPHFFFMLFPICAFLQKTSKIEGSAALFGAFLKVFLPPDFAPEIEDFSAYKQREN